MEVIKKRKLEDNGVVFPPESAGGLSSDDLRKIIDPFTYEQLFQIVQTAALRHLDVLDAVRSIADRDPTRRKLFVRGLGWETTSDSLRTVFAAYGDLEEAVVILDKTTGKSKGYGFVTYRHLDGALMALKEASKKIDGRMTVTQVASAGFSGGVTVTPISQTLVLSSRKIYVGNVPYDMPAERLLAHFLSYGEVEEGPIGFDKATGKSKGFALFVYKNVEGARASLVESVKTIDGHQLHCRLANEGKKGKPSGVTGMQPPPVVQPMVASSAAQPAAGVKPEANFDRQGLNTLPVVQPVGAASATQLAGSVKPEANVDRQRLNTNQQGSFALQYGGGGPVGISTYGGNIGGLGLPGQGSLPLGHSQHRLNLSSGSGPGLYSFGSVGGPGSQAPSSLGDGSGGFNSSLGGGGPHHGSHVGGPGSNYGGLGNAGGVGLGGAGSGFGGSGYGLPSGPARMSSGGYPESAHYSLSSGYQSQHHQATGTSPATRVPARGTYQGPPYH